MFDLETWGLRPGSALRSVGAVVFSMDKHEPMGPAIYGNITRASCEQAGLIVDPGTEAFWLKRDDGSAKILAVDQMPVHEAVAVFHAWCIEQGVTYLWSASISFDLPMWMAAADAVKLNPPWKHFNTRDAQTLFAVKGFDVRSMPLREAGYKTAAQNALFQARCVRAAYGMEDLPPPSKPVSDLFG